MSGGRLNAALIGLLVAGCMGSVFFVFFTMRGRGEPFAAVEHRSTPAPPRETTLQAPDPRPPPAEGAPDPERETKREPERAPLEPEEGAGEEEKEEKGGAGDPTALAELILELLTPEEAKERVVTVRVRDEGGEPVPDALVVFREGAKLLYRERSDIYGEARFEPWEAEPGPYRVDAIAFGYVTATAPSTAAGATVQLVLRVRPSVAGKVRAPSRGHGTVKLFTEDHVLTTRIEEDGSFLFEDLDEGTVTVQADVPPYGSDAHTLYLHAGMRQLVRLNVHKRRMRIYGQLRQWPGKGAAFINGVRLAVTALGTYEFKHAVNGMNEIYVDAPGRALVRKRFQVKTVATSQHNFTLRREARVKGRVVSARTRVPIEGAEVRLGVAFDDPRNDRVPYFPVDRVPVVKSGDRGKFEITRLDRHLIYLVSVVAPGYGQWLGEAVPNGGHLSVRLPEGPFVYGRLGGIGGVPRDAVVTAERLQERPESRRFNVRHWDGTSSGRDRKGFYGLSGLLPGLYRVRVDAAEYGSVETILDLQEGLRHRVDLRVRRGVHRDDEDAEMLQRLPPVIYTDPEDLAPDELTLLRVDTRRPGGEIPLRGVIVRFFDGEDEMAPPMEFTEPEFDLIGLPEAAYRAVLTHPLLRKPIVRGGIRLRRAEPYTLTLR